jgi:hypothetical protein
VELIAPPDVTNHSDDAPATDAFDDPTTNPRGELEALERAHVLIANGAAQRILEHGYAIEELRPIVVGGSSSRQSEGPTAMYVCLCNALTDRQVKQAAATAGTTDGGGVLAGFGAPHGDARMPGRHRLLLVRAVRWQETQHRRPPQLAGRFA